MRISLFLDFLEIPSSVLQDEGAMISFLEEMAGRLEGLAPCCLGKESLALLKASL